MIYYYVNNALRQNSPMEPVWQKYTLLLNEAIDILKDHAGPCNRYKEVYRGQRNCVGLKKGKFIFKGFTSTSLSPTTAFDFGKPSANSDDCMVFFLIKKAEGLELTKFSMVPKEEEVLMKSGSVVTITKLYLDALHLDEEKNDAKKIIKMLKKIGFTEEKKAHVFVQATFVKKSRQKRDTRCETLNTASYLYKNGSAKVFTLLSLIITSSMI